MDKINLEEILEEEIRKIFFGFNPSEDFCYRDRLIAKNAMKEACKQCLELAAEKASIDFVENKNYESSTQSDSFSFRDGDGNWCEISIYEASIINVINLIE